MQEFTLTSRVRESLNLEGHRNGGTRVRKTDRWDDQPGSPPSWRSVTASSSESCESASVGPGEVLRAQRRAVVTGVLFSQATVGWRVFGVYENEAVGKVFDVGHKDKIGGVWGRISTNRDLGDELAEESERGGGDVNLFLLFPNNKGVVELLGDSECGQIPWLDDGH